MNTQTKLFFQILMLAALILAFGSTSAQQPAGSKMKSTEAVFAGGCFWCMEPPFEKLKGVVDVKSGYGGGKGTDPTYENYAQKGHLEVVRVVYDPAQVGYKKLLDVFWRQINPTDAGGQFCDRGHEYSSAIYYMNDEQKRLAEASKAALDKSGRYKAPVVTPIIPYTNFYPAEKYHQDYYKKHSLKYKFYRYNCGRDRYLEKTWGANH